MAKLFDSFTEALSHLLVKKNAAAGASTAITEEGPEPTCLFVSSDWVNCSKASLHQTKRRRALGNVMLGRSLPTSNGACRVCIIADTHEEHTSVIGIPECDVLIHAGDILLESRVISRKSAIRKYQHFNEWLGTLQARCGQILVIGGNHDFHLEDMGHDAAQALLNNALLLSNTVVELSQESRKRPLTLFGCSASRGASDNRAWQSTECLQESAAAWNESAFSSADSKAPDILVTHSMIPHLLTHNRPRMYVYGHIHAQYGACFDGDSNILFICGSIMDQYYRPSHVPIVVDIP